MPFYSRFFVAATVVGVAGFASAPAQAQSFYVDAKPTLCVDLVKGQTVRGNQIILWGCHGKAPQIFTFDGSGRVRYKANPAFCVEQQRNGRFLELTECAFTTQKWRYDAPTHRVMNGAGQCWDVPGGRFNPLQRMGVWPCHDKSPQKLTYR